MTLYAPNNVNRVQVSPAQGGCGTVHERENDDRLSVDCPSCVLAMSKMPLFKGWGTTPETAALTEDELAQLEYEKQRGDQVMHGAGAALAELVKSGLLAQQQEAAPARKPRARKVV